MNISIKKEPGAGPSSMESVGHMMEVKKEAGLSSSATNSPSIVTTSVNVKSQLVSKIKMALVQAWSQRWNEIRWAIQLKKLLAAYSSENVDVAEILMEQGLVGSSPNSLILSYLKHSVLSLMIPFHSVLKCITRFEDFSRPYCILALLHLAETFGSKISLSYCQEQPLQMVGSQLKLLHWLVKAMLICLQKVPDQRSSSSSSHLPHEYFVIMDNSSKAIYNILERPCIGSLMQIAKADNMEEYREFEQCQMNARGTLSQISASSLPEETRENCSKALGSLARVDENLLSLDPVLETSHSPINPSLHGLICLEALLNKNPDTHPFINQLLTIAKLSKLSLPQVCLEIFRACFMGFMDSKDEKENLQWATFTFLKVPDIIKQLTSERDISSEVEVAMDMLLEYSHLLDQMDIKLGGDIVNLLLSECVKVGVLKESQKALLSQRRAEQRSRLHNTDSKSSTGWKSISYVIQSESTVNSILMSLDSDPIKKSETLVKVLTMMNEHYLQIVRLAASCMGKLQEYLTKLIRINECVSHPSNEMNFRSTRSQLFDATFIMIVDIVQQSGLESIQASRENEMSLVVQWIKRWLPEDGRYKNPELTPAEDQDKIDRILNMLLTNSEIVPTAPLNSWKDLIMSFPFAIQEILFALEHQAITLDKVKIILDHIRHQNTKCLLLVSCTYLCSFMNVVGAVARSTPLKMLEMLMQGIENKQLEMILDNVIFDILPEGHGLKKSKRYLIPHTRLTGEIICDILTETFHRGWLDLESLHTIDQLLALRGPDWVVGHLVEQLSNPNQSEDVCQSLHLAFAIMHMDLERMTISLLHSVLPRLLTQNSIYNNTNNMLSHPQSYCLAKLCILCITATRTSKYGQKEPYIRRLRKRHAVDLEIEDDLDESETSPCKLRKLSEPQLSFGLEEFNLDILGEKEEVSESIPTYVLKEPFNKVIANLFHVMNSILSLPTLTRQTWFIVSFIQEALKCGGEHTRFILQFMPPNMVNNIMRCLPGVFSSQHILRICDLSTPAGRKIAAKVICNNAQTASLSIVD